MSLLTNKYAKFKYEITDEYEAGMVLGGGQVKALRGKEANLRDSIVKIQKGEFWLMNLDFSNPNLNENIKLLLSQKEMTKLNQIVGQKQAYIVPLNIHLKGNFLKLQVGLGKHKKQFDKRDTIKKADTAREIDRALKDSSKY